MTTEIEPLAQAVLGYYHEAKSAKQRRMKMNQDNFDAYNLNGDFSHKRKGQSREFLPKQQMAVEQITSFLTQGLMDQSQSDGWFDIEFKPGFEPKILTAAEWKMLLNDQLKKIQFDAFFQDTLKSGLLGSLMIAKVHGEYKQSVRYAFDKPTFENPGVKPSLKRKSKLVFQVRDELVRQEDFYPDPTGSNRYRIHRIEMDYYDLVNMAKLRPDVYDMDAIEAMPHSSSTDQTYKKARETDQNIPIWHNRRRVEIIECWGTILDKDGSALYENSVCAVTPSGDIIRRPGPIDNWDGEDPFVAVPIVRVPNSVWHRAVMDAATKINLAQNEMYNLMLDGGIMAVFGIKQVRMNWLENPEEVEDGIAPGQTLAVNNTCPPQGKVLERVDTGAVSQEALAMFNLIDREGQASALSNDVRNGNLPQRATKATEIVAANNTLTGIFNGFVKYIEENFVGKVLMKNTLQVASHVKELPEEELKALFGQEKAAQLLQYTNEEVFAEFANGGTIRVYGMTQVMNRMNDFKKLTTLLQTIGASPDLMQEFRLNYSIKKFLGELMKNLGINIDKIKPDPAEQARAQQMIMAQMQAQAGGQKQPNGMSQIPAAGNQTEQTGMDQMQANMPHANGEMGQ
jgi:hypothetical protein